MKPKKSNTQMVAKKSYNRNSRSKTYKNTSLFARPLNFSKTQLLAFAICFGVIGVATMLLSRAETITLATLEAESMTLASGSNIISDATASGSAVKFSGNATITGTLSTSQDSTAIVVRARGSQCQGAPQLSLKVDNSILQTVSVSSTTWTDYTVSSLLASGSHSVSISFTNDYTSIKGKSGKVQCKRELFVDKVTVYGEATPTTPPSTEGYPASYFSGPLGQNNILPKDPNGALFIEWFGAPMTEQQTRDMTVKRMNDTGRKFDGIGHQLDQLTVSGVTSEQWVKSQGSFSVVTWSPSGSPSDVANGYRDAELASVANRYKSLGSPIMLRPWHEFNGNWFPWSATASSCPTWVQGWQRMATVFRQNGATNVGFVWTPTEGQDRSIRDACYPGDSYVDWVSTTAYNGCLGTQDWCTPLHGGWATFREIFDYTSLGSPLVSTYSKYGAQKPFIISENSSKCNPNDVNGKGNWFRAIDSQAKPVMPNLRGIMFFDQDVSPAEPGNDWRVDTCPVGIPSPESYAGWIDLAKAARWNVGRR